MSSRSDETPLLPVEPTPCDHGVHRELHDVSRPGLVWEVVAGLSDQIHQPLAAITNYVGGALLRLKDDSATREDIAKIFTAIGEICQRAASINRRIRTFAATRMPGFTSVDVRDVVDNARLAAQPLLARHDVDLVVEFVGDLPNVRGDVTQLVDLVCSLLANSIESIRDHDGDERLVHLTVAVDEEGMLRLTVRDTGSGVPADAVRKAFDVFYTTKPDGLGLGLAMSSSIAERHGGRLWLEESSTPGAVFHVALPPTRDLPDAPGSPSISKLLAAKDDETIF